MPPPVEPTLAAFPNPFIRYIAATRPPFLSVTFAACLVGLATAALDGAMLRPAAAFFTVFFALVAHAGINVLNDYYDALNGSDAANTERQFPFTGGSRFIQNGVLSLRAAGVFGYALLAAVIPAGLWLAWTSADGLIAIGLAGMFVGWAYSAPPFKLMSRGLGEAAVACGWLIVVVGADYVQRGAFSALPFVAGLPYALHVANVLYINQFPDYRADAATGKRNWVVRLGPQRARYGYPLVVGIAYGWLLGAVALGALPWTALLALATLAPALGATKGLLAHAAEPRRLVPAIRATIGAAMLHGILLAVGLAAARLV
ncbi:MAG: 1,4-dihydroxy-2-naphthoate octaprenyltransferase [Rhodocyclaceae bacterium]|nr:MAG: prenyltransferase [Rhodocyclaceae bacterium]MBV6406566.1 1,4-dihydroxy-2-naphthoate octaprenyltransferase [Rhodocyclaceae bacterium]CAG0929428.1 1,4-dihydroxy-2-naphthoate octaprenyltransferase [Rhodocyclaceae bacterium]